MNEYIEIGDMVSFKHENNYSMGEVVAMFGDGIKVKFGADDYKKILGNNDRARLQWKKGDG